MLLVLYDFAPKYTFDDTPIKTQMFDFNINKLKF